MATSHDLTRRRFLQATSAAGLLAALSGTRARGETAPVAAAPSATRARSVIFVVSDGMNSGTITLAELYARNIENRGTHWAALMNMPGVHMGLQDTASANSLVTDSSAAASAWGCGHRINNGALNITPDGIEREPILVTARRAGKGTGVVTTTRVTYATPAGFIANVDKRSAEDTIAVQYLERGIDVMMGGGRRHFAEELRPDAHDLEGEFVQTGHLIVRTRDELAAAPTSKRRLLGVFWDDHVPYALDRANDPTIAAKVPSLAEMTRAALARLAQEPNGFVLQIEGGRVDHAAHANDAGALVHEQLDLDAALADIIAFQREHPDTLVIVTADHGTGNPGLNGEGETARALQNLSRIRASFDAMLHGLTAEQPVEDFVARLAKGSGLPVTAEQAEEVRAALAGKSGAVYTGMRTARPVLGQVMANHLAIGWSGRWHTGDWVVLNAFGPGSAAFPHLVRNDAIHGLMLEALGIG